MRKFVLYGSGGHARVVTDLITQLGGKVMVCFDNEHPYDPTCFPDAELIIAIGNSEARKRIANEVQHRLATLVHPWAYVAADVELGEGTVVLANATVQAAVKLGKHAIINANVTVDHDAVIGNFVTTYPGAYIAGGIKVPDGSRVESNQVIAC